MALHDTNDWPGALERVIAALIKLKNAAEPGSTEHRIAIRLLAGLRDSYKNPGSLLRIWVRSIGAAILSTDRRVRPARCGRGEGPSASGRWFHRSGHPWAPHIHMSAAMPAIFSKSQPNFYGAD
jgi:hypothetical protein